MIIPVKNNSNDEFLACVFTSKLESRMLITITNSNSSPEVNSSEVSLKLQCEFCMCTRKHPKHVLGGGAYVTFVFVHTCLNTNSFLSRIHILKMNCNHHYNDHSNYEFSLVCVRSDHSKDELQSSFQRSFKLRICSRA